jgi:hypothetical protein
MAFYNDIGDLPDGLTIDRRDNNKGYWKDNIRFATMTEQARNKRTNVVNENTVRQIRAEYATGNYTMEQLGEKYLVSGQHISKIIRRKVWKDI